MGRGLSGQQIAPKPYVKREIRRAHRWGCDHYISKRREMAPSVIKFGRLITPWYPFSIFDFVEP